MDTKKTLVEVPVCRAPTQPSSEASFGDTFINSPVFCPCWQCSAWDRNSTDLGSMLKSYSRN